MAHGQRQERKFDVVRLLFSASATNYGRPQRGAASTGKLNHFNVMRRGGQTASSQSQDQNASPQVRRGVGLKIVRSALYAADTSRRSAAIIVGCESGRPRV